MSIIEQRISKNKKVFDVHEPDEGHFNRFESKLQKLHPETKKVSQKRLAPVFIRVAAVGLILLAASGILFNYPALFEKNATLELSPELVELDQYYANQNQQKMREIESVVGEDQEMLAMKDKAMHKVTRLQDNTEKLKTEYVENNENEKVYGALVSNYRLLSSALDKVLDSMHEIKYKKTSN